MSYLVAFLISLAISVIVLIISMLGTSRYWGGIDFGPVKTAILKSAGLLIAVNLVSLIPGFGWLLVLVVWFVGLMVLFQLDLWQTVTLVFVNWVLNILLAILLFMILASVLPG